MTIFDTTANIERKVWTPFKYHARLNTNQIIERAIVFGLYSGAYLNGVRYLQAYQEFELVMLLDNYNSQLASLDADRQKTLIDIVAKRYISDVEGMIHIQELNTQRQKIDAENIEWDSKFNALASDRAAIITMQARLESERLKVAARIKTLQAQIMIEEIDQQLQVLAVAEKRLAAVRAESDLARKDIQILEAQIANIKKDIEIIRLDVENRFKLNAIAKANLNLLEIDNAVLQKDLDKKSKQLDLVKTDLDVQRVLVEKTLKQAELIITDAKIEDKRADIIDGDVRIQEIALDGQRLLLDAANQQVELKSQTVGMAEVNNKIVGLQNEVMAKQVELIERDNILSSKTLEQTAISLDIQRQANELLRQDVKLVEAQTHLVATGLDIARSQLSLQRALNEQQKQALDIAEAQTRLVMKDIDKQEMANRLIKEQLNYNQIDLDKANIDVSIQEENLQALEKDLQTLQAGSDILKIQMQIVETGLKQLEAQKQVAQMNLDTANLTADQLKTQRFQIELANANLRVTKEQMATNEESIRAADIGVDIAKVNNQINEIPLRYLDISKEVSNINRSIAEMQIDATQTDILDAQLMVENAEYNYELDQLQIYPKQIASIQAEKNLITNENANTINNIAQYAGLHISEMALLDEKNLFRIDELNQQSDEKIDMYQERIDISAMERDFTDRKRAPLTLLTDLEATTIFNRGVLTEMVDKEEINALTQVMAADIMTTLMHKIG